MSRTDAAPIPAGWRVWLLASRPATLPAAITPVLVGTAVATVDADLRVGPFIAALFAALLIQFATNFANDLFDFQSGADHEGRLGPTRATHAGWVTPAQMRTATVLALAGATGIGIYLIIVAGWPILVVGVAAMVAGLAYTGGPWPYGYHGLGDVFVFVFFGIVAVMGSFFVQAEQLTWEAFAAAVPVGLTVTAILVVNNLRDIDSDRLSGKGTLAVLLGASRTRFEFGALVATALALPLIFAATDLMPWWSLESWFVLPLALWVVWRVAAGTVGRDLNPVLKQTGQLHLVFGVLLALSYVW